MLPGKGEAGVLPDPGGTVAGVDSCQCCGVPRPWVSARSRVAGFAAVIESADVGGGGLAAHGLAGFGGGGLGQNALRLERAGACGAVWLAAFEAPSLLRCRDSRGAVAGGVKCGDGRVVTGSLPNETGVTFRFVPSPFGIRAMKVDEVAVSG